jgi:hypothetical protein
MDFKEKLQSLQFTRGKAKTIKRNGESLGEVHVDHSGNVSSIVTPKVHSIGVVGHPVGGK